VKFDNDLKDIWELNFINFLDPERRFGHSVKEIKIKDIVCYFKWFNIINYYIIT